MPLRQLYPDPNAKSTASYIHLVDIIAVHGLNPRRKNDRDHAWDTWRKPSGPQGRLWLRDDLPQHLLQPRIFLYEYNSTAVFGKDRDTFIGKASELLEAITIERKDIEPRPILFLGHSIGGLLIKQALINAHNNPKYMWIKVATTGLVFFATPHHGRDTTLVSLGGVVAEIATAIGYQKGDDVLETLKSGSIFSEIMQKHWRHQLLKYDIISFWGALDKIVPAESARFGMPVDRENVVKLNADHSGVCKFGPSLEDQDNLKEVRGGIRNLCAIQKYHYAEIASAISFGDANSGFQAGTISGSVNVEFDLLLSKVADDLNGGDGQTPLPSIAYRVHNTVLLRIFKFFNAGIGAFVTSVPNIVHRLHLRILWLLRPRLAVGQRRLEWQCNCGMPLYGDFRGNDEEINKLVREIQTHGFLVTQSGHGVKRLPAGSRQTTSSNAELAAPLRSNTSHATQSTFINTSQVVGGIPNITASNTDTAGALSTSAIRGPKFVALCVNSGLFQKTYEEVDITTIRKDTQMFHGFKTAYEACRSSRINVIRGWCTKPVDINYIQFAAEGLKHGYPIAGSPDCTICAHMENKDDLVVMRKYEPHRAASALAHPPIPADLFFHLWECPGDITPALQAMWLNRLPKKLDEKLEKACLGTRPDAEIIIGWGVLIVEGLHKRRISRLTTAIAALAIVISVAYSAGKKDVSSGFAIGALVIACWAVFITAIYFEFQDS